MRVHCLCLVEEQPAASRKRPSTVSELDRTEFIIMSKETIELSTRTLDTHFIRGHDTTAIICIIYGAFWRFWFITTKRWRIQKKNTFDGATL